MEKLLLLSGLLCDDTVWCDVSAITSATIDTQIVNFPDFGSITRMAEHVLGLAPRRCAVAGHSMGGRVALEVARLAPDRLDRIALFNTGIHPRREAEIQSRGRLVSLARELGMTALAAEWLPPMMGASQARIDVLMPRLTAMVERATADSFAAQQAALLDRPDAAAVLASIAVPVLLASGRADRWSPLAQHEEMLRLNPAARLVAIEDAGHMAPIEQPAAVAAALREWLTVRNHTKPPAV